jgi:polyhydroxyalkanoate synthesis regulator phasin
LHIFGIKRIADFREMGHGTIARGGESMLEPLRRLLLAGLGTVDLTEEKLRAVFDDLVARGEVNEKEARELISSWAKRAGEQRTKIQQLVDDSVRRALDRMGAAHRSDLEKLEARIAELERRLPREPEAG